MPVPIPDDEVEHPRVEIGTDIGPVRSIFLEEIKHVFGADNLFEAAKDGCVLELLAGPLLEGSQHAREGLPELAQRRVVRHDEQRGLRVRDADPVRDPGRREGCSGNHRADLVLHQRSDQRSCHIRLGSPGWPLGNRTKAVLAPVGPSQPERKSLSSAPGFGGGQPSGERPKIERRDLDGGRPEVAVVSAEQPAT